MKEIQLLHIDKCFGNKQVFCDCSLSFPIGKTTLLMGESGRGKTTLFHLLMGFETPDKGEIVGLPPSIAVAFQDDALCPALSVFDNIRLALPARAKEDILSALTAVGLENDIHTKAKDLSGGMGRRTAIVRAMLSTSPLILLDEPFRGLDQESKVKTALLIRNERKDRTLIVITHDPHDRDLLGADAIVTL